jgi:hypothetical protein
MHLVPADRGIFSSNSFNFWVHIAYRITSLSAVRRAVCVLFVCVRCGILAAGDLRAGRCAIDGNRRFGTHGRDRDRAGGSFQGGGVDVRTRRGNVERSTGGPPRRPGARSRRSVEPFFRSDGVAAAGNAAASGGRLSDRPPFRTGAVAGAGCGQPRRRIAFAARGSRRGRQITCRVEDRSAAARRRRNGGPCGSFDVSGRRGPDDGADRFGRDRAGEGAVSIAARLARVAVGEFRLPGRGECPSGRGLVFRRHQRTIEQPAARLGGDGGAPGAFDRLGGRWPRGCRSTFRAKQDFVSW